MRKTKMTRTHIYLSPNQTDKLHKKAEEKGITISEIIRRFIDEMLAKEEKQTNSNTQAA